MMTATMPIPWSADPLAHPLAERLLRSSARHSYDPEVDIDWDARIPEGLWGMQPERMSLYGTDLWETLSEDQRIELSRHEVASIASVGLWFELILMQMMVRDLYDADPRGQHMHYALTEIADECRHSTMFGKSIAHFGVPAYGPVPRVHRLGRLFKTVVHGPSAYASILVAEEVLDTWQRELMNDERVQPVTRMVSRIHVLEEARHMTFARDEVRRTMPELSGTSLLWHQVVTAQTCYLVARSLVNPEVYRSVGINPAEGRRTALGNPHYRETMRWMGEKPLAFLEENNLMPWHQMKVWRGSLLLG
ncbi:MAG: AurF N-oxygenase family protein [Marmoricola sp.]